MYMYMFPICLYIVIHSGNDPKSDLGPLITPQAKDRVCHLIESGEKDGAEVMLDGRDCVVPGYEKGNFVGA